MSHSQEGQTRPARASFKTSLPILLAIVVIPLVALSIYLGCTYTGLTNSDAMDFAQLGRSMSEGRGFSTLILRPLALSHGTDPLSQPDVTHGPLYPFILALAFGLADAKDWVVVGVASLFYLLTVPLVYVLGRRLFGQAVGVVSALVFAVNALSLQYAASGLEISLYVFLTTALLLTLHEAYIRIDGQIGQQRRLPRGARGPLVLAGVLCGLLYLTDPVFIWVGVGTCVAVWVIGGRTRGRAVGVIAGSFAMLAVPWMLRNGSLTGDPIFGLRGDEILMYTPHYYPGYSAYRLEPGALIASGGLFHDFTNKLVQGLGTFARALPQHPAIWILAFFLPALYVQYTERATNAVLTLTLTLAAALLAGSLLFNVDMPRFVAVVPAMLVFSVAAIDRLARTTTEPKRALRLSIAWLSAALILPIIADITAPRTQNATADMTTARRYGRMAQASDVCLSDQPWLVAWYADRPAMMIPQSDEYVGQLRSRFQGLRWMFLTAQVSDYSGSWKYLHDAFQNWNIASANAQANKQTPIQPIRIAGGKEPLFKAVRGFMAVPPNPASLLSTVIAVSTPVALGQSQASTTPAAARPQAPSEPAHPAATG